MNLRKILQLIALPMIVIAAVITASLIKSFSPEIRNYTILIVLLSQICTILGLLFFSDLFGFGGIKDWIQFAQELNTLKEETVKKSLLELKGLSNIAKILGKKVPGLAPIDDYNNYLQQKIIKSSWVLGASLIPTLKNPEVLLQNLKKGIVCKYLCAGDKDTIKYRAEQIAKHLYKEDPGYLTEGNLKITWIEPHFIPLPMSIYNAEENDREVLISFPSEIEATIEKKCAILLREEEAVRVCIENFVRLWDSYKKNELELISLIQ